MWVIALNVMIYQDVKSEQGVCSGVCGLEGLKQTCVWSSDHLSSVLCGLISMDHTETG